MRIGPFSWDGANFNVKLTEALDDLRGRIERVTVTTTNMVNNLGSGYNSSASVKIAWKNKEAEAAFNELQKAYDAKVQEIRDNNKLPTPPGAGASQEEWQNWLSESQKVIQSVNLQILLLGGSPADRILSDTKDSKDFKKVSSEVEIMPQISRKRDY